MNPIITPRLCLRAFSVDDLDDFYEIMADPKVNRFLPWFSPSTKQEALKMLQEKYLYPMKNQQGIHLAIEESSEKKVIGYINISYGESHDLGYGLLSQYWRKGYAKEACIALIDSLKNSPLEFITSTHDVNNPHSGYVMQKIGMKYCYSYIEQWQPKDISVTFRLYQLNLKEGMLDYLGYWNLYRDHFIENIEKEGSD